MENGDIQGIALKDHHQPLYEQMISLEHLFLCWEEYRRGKRKRKDVSLFERTIEDELFDLHEKLHSQTYRHSSYKTFTVFDPKIRSISKAQICDRLVHHVVANALKPLFEPRFYFHSYSCRVGKGTHVAINHLIRMLRKASKNHTLPVYGLKMDVKRFFDTVHHSTLKSLLRKQLNDPKVLNLIDLIIDSFNASNDPTNPCGLPLGNVTSQLFANIYLHELDHFVKHQLKAPYYLRYCDDFLLISKDRSHLKNLIAPISKFLIHKLHLTIHPKKIILRKWQSGIDFLGTLSFPHYKLLRTKTRRRLERRLKEGYHDLTSEKISATTFDQKLQSYLGMLSHTHQKTLVLNLKNLYWVRS